MGACGATSTAALCISGASPSRVTNVESWNGSAWTEIADVNQERYYTTGSGSQTDALLIAGQDPPVMANVEKWNGSSWTEVGDLNLARFALASSSNPSGSDDTLAFGGHTASPDADKTNTESWNGTSWTEIADLSSAIAYHSGAGSDLSAALSFGGSSPSVTGASEEFTTATSFTKQNLGQVYYNSGSNAFKVTQQSTPAGTWASGPNINNARFQAGGGGATQNASWIVGGAPGTKAFHEQYDGSSWTEVADLGTAKYAVMSLGTTTAALVAGGYDGAYENDVEVWDGSSWTEVADINTIRGYGGAAGTTTAGIIYGGHPGGLAVTETWNGSSWTEVADLNTGGTQGGKPSNGTQTAAIFSGGLRTASNSGKTETWDGSSWTETTDMNTARAYQWGFGTSTAQLVCGGNDGSLTGKTESWNGSAWTEVADLATASVSNNPNGGGTATAGIVAAGYTSTALSTSEEWTVDQSNNTITVG
jgi:hypothetical protein